MMRRNVLLFHNAALGDFVMTWPIALALGRVLAQSRIVYVTSVSKGRLAERFIKTEFADIETGWHGLYQDPPQLSDKVRQYLNGLQIGIVFSQEPQSRFICHLRDLTGNQGMIIPVSPHPVSGVHVWEHQRRQLQDLAVLYDAVGQIHHLIESQGISRSRKNSPCRLLIHPGSGSVKKNWSVDSFSRVASHMQRYGWDVRFILGEVERDKLPVSNLRIIQRVAPVVWCGDLDQLADQLQDSDAYLGNDSGPTHLAALTGLATVAMFGPNSDPTVWAPRGPRVKILRFDSPPESVVESLLNVSAT
ncbi:MAG: hypothetical protein KatS3mg104_1689 [Phycisphaerae bacterium]|jgi:hypothetical protein|nr:MAG: hypothetical protein KatS3mg104_1689 [Phycisphaerae bacterium]